MQQKTKVFYMITKGVWGGAQEYVYTMATSLPRDTFETVVLCGEGHVLQDKLTTHGIRSYTLAHLKRDISFVDEFKSFFALVKLIRKERPAVLHLNSSKIGFLGALAGRIARVPRIIFTAHNWAFNYALPWYSRVFFFIIHWCTVFMSHTTIAVSEKIRMDMDMPGIRNKITVIYNGIGKIDFLTKTAARKELIQRMGIAKSPAILIGTVSELHKNKGLDILVEAARKLPDTVSVCIIGDGEEKYSVAGMIKSYGLESKVFLLGRIEDARQYLKAFDIFTLTSRTEALPYAILEAGQAECALVASKVGGIPEIITNNESGILVKKESSGEVLRAIEYLLNNPEKRKSYGKRLKEQVRKKFSLEKMITQTAHIYEQDRK